ncbi:MAG: pilus assembly protein [Raoultibacter sp.]
MNALSLLPPLRHQRAHLAPCPLVRGQASVECAFAALMLFALICPCVEFGRMANDNQTASCAATDLARAVAANPSMTRGEQQSFLRASYPSLGDAATFGVAVSAPHKQAYDHHLYTRNWEMLTRPSFTTYRDITATLSVSRAFITPAGALLGPLVGGDAQHYELNAQGRALRDETVESGGW